MIDAIGAGLAILTAGGFTLALGVLIWSILQRQQTQPTTAEAWPASRQPDPEPAAEPDTWSDDFTPAAPEPEPDWEPEPRPHRIFALAKGGKDTRTMTEAEYQAWFADYQQRQAASRRLMAEWEQQRAAARAEAEAQAAAEAAAIAQMPAWVVAFAAQYKLRRLDEMTLLQNWIALVLQVARNRGDTFPAKVIWKEVAQAHGAAAPDDRFISYMFFYRLNEALIAAGIVTRGQRRQAARLNVDRLPEWVM